MLFSLPAVGCALIGVEPDVIDVANDESGTEGQATTAEGQGTEGADTSQEDTGEEDPGGDGDGDPGDGDGDSSTGDGDGDGDPLDETSCQELGATPVVLGPNDVTIPAAASVLEGECGNPGPESIYSFVSDVSGDVTFTLTANFDAALYAVDGVVCVPLVELMCVNTPDSLTIAVEAEQIVHVVIDSELPDGGAGTLDVAIVP